MEIKKGNTLQAKIIALSSEGKGIAKLDDGFVIFCENTLPGDEVSFTILKKKNNYAEAKLEEILKESPDRIKPRCKHFGVCGGCKVQNYSYDKQIEFKTETVKNAFEKIGGFENITVPMSLKSDEEYFYRNKMEFSFSTEQWLTEINKDQPREFFAFGLHIPKFHSKILNIEECFLQSETSYKVVNFTREFFKSRNSTIYSVRTHSGYLRFLVIRQSKNTKDFMVNLITYDYDEDLINEYSKLLREQFPEVTTFINSFSQNKAQVAFAENFRILFGEGMIYEKMYNGKDEFIFQISPNSFFQTNTLQAQKLYEVAASFGDFNKNDRVLDLYCGTGSISIFISKMVKGVLGVELINESIESAMQNSELNKIDNVEYIVSDIKDFLKNNRAIEIFNKVILDPPRSGLHPDICEILSDLKFEKIVYVSCNPSTQARDLKIILSKGNYEIGRIQPVDMFPQTYHTENVVELNFKQ